MNIKQTRIKATLRRTLLLIISPCIVGAVLLLSPGVARAQIDGTEPCTVAGSAGATVDEGSLQFYEFLNNYATMKAGAPVGTKVVYRYNLPPQGDTSGGHFNFDCTSCRLDMLVRYRDNGPGFRVIVRIWEARLTKNGLILHNLFDSNDPQTTYQSAGTFSIDGDPVPFDPNPANPNKQSVYDVDAPEGTLGEHDGAAGNQPVRFGGSAFFLEVELTKLSATGEGGFFGAAIFQY